uniref:Uncharacterized protein n=1 Tax=Anguilla anguilla TaxID=7936 RepID=A0A0E9UHM9_ANGAN
MAVLVLKGLLQKASEHCAVINLS